MSKANYLTTYPTSYALGSVILVVFLGALLGIFGQIAQSIAPYLAAILLALVCVRVFIGTSVWLLNRICRHCREALSATSDDTAACDIDPTTERLKSTVDSMRREEASCAARYSQRRCSSDDLIRAKSLRIQAEIELLRQEAMPKSWAEACQNVHAQT
jgi:hypothetical protein